MSELNEQLRKALESCITSSYIDIDRDFVKTYRFDEKLVSEALTALRATPAPQAAPSDYTVDDSELARKILVFLGRATSGSMEPGADPLRDRLAQRLAVWRPAAAPTSLTQAAPSEPVAMLAARAQGREEALAALLHVDPDVGINDYMICDTDHMGEGCTTWDEKRLRDLFSIGDQAHDAYDRAEAAYWQALGEKDEAERAKNFAANMHNSGKVRAVLEKAGEYDLIAGLCSRPAPPAPAQQAEGDARDAALEEAAKICDGLHDQWRWPDGSSGPNDCAVAIRAAIASATTSTEGR